MIASIISAKSVSSSGRTTCVSGSPKRQLYSTTFAPLDVSINPKYRQPLNGLPSALIALIVGMNIFSMHSVAISGVYRGLGAIVPIPPVLRPSSLS